jgi:hypothetical protein
MKISSITALLLWTLVFGVAAQPLTNTGPLVTLDFDGNGTMDSRYFASATKTGDRPENWIVGFSLEPFGSSRFLRANSTRITFQLGESIGGTRRALTNYLPDLPRPPIESYGFTLLLYRATKTIDVWEYSSFGDPLFERESDLLFGLRLALTTGTHHAWLRMSRPVVDSHTPFELVDYAVHPVPGEPIPAGQPPPLPPLRTTVDSEGLSFSWDSRWGSLVLESTTDLLSPTTWETVLEGAGGPVTVPADDEQRFYRLRTPSP